MKNKIQNTETETKNKSTVKAFFLSSFFIFLMIPTINIVIDPTTVFFNKKRILEPHLSMTWLPLQQVISSKTDCTAFLFGTSKILPWDTNKLNQRPCKLSYPAKGVQSYERALRILIAHGIKIDHVIITIEREMFYNQENFGYVSSAESGLEYPENYQEILYALRTILFANTWTNIQNFFAPPHEEEYWRPHFRLPSETILRELHYRWEPGREQEKFANRQEHEKAINEIPSLWRVSKYDDYQPEQAMQSLKNIVSLAAQHNIKLVIVRPPTFVKNIAASEKNSFLDAYRQLAEIVGFIDFSYDIAYLSKPHLWIDSVHYRREVAKIIMENLNARPDDMEFGRYVTSENIEQHLQEFESNMYKNFINNTPHPPNTLIHKSWVISK